MHGAAKHYQHVRTFLRIVMRACVYHAAYYQHKQRICYIRAEERISEPKRVRRE